ncbi:hypothetical protein B7760_04232 [Burkholderia glumae]|nr:hypothetical protein B7760_04232 [Burkholderia glumae]
MRRFLLRCIVGTLVIGFGLALTAGCTSDPPNPNPRAAVPLSTVPVDLPRYMGRWYVIAHIPYFAERGFVGSRAQWTLRADGRIDDVFVGRKGASTSRKRAIGSSTR